MKRRKKGLVISNKKEITMGSKELEKHYKNPGITLISLVITIIVLLILAGVSLSAVLSQDGIFSRASKSAIIIEIAKVEETAQMIYSEKIMDKAENKIGSQVETSEIIVELQNLGNHIEKRLVAEGNITGISLDKTSMTIGINKTAEIKVTYEGVEDPFVYYLEIQDEYYQMHSNKGFITIDKEPSEIGRENGTGSSTLTVQSSDTTVATAELKAGSTNTIEISSLEKEGEITVVAKYGSLETRPCTIIVKDIPIAIALEMNSVRARIAVGYTRWLGAMTTPSDALQEFDWSSSDTSIATVDNNGVVTAKKAGKTTITAKTTDGSNQEGTCEVTVVETDKMVADLTDYQTKNTVAKDVNGNLITVPGDFKVLTNLGTKVIEGIVIQDKDGNEFVWIPVDSVSTGTSKMADDIRLGRYEDFTTKNASGNYVPKQDADNYTQIVTIADLYQELTSNSGNTAAKNLGDFVDKTKANGGYYFARYEASNNGSNKPLSQADKKVWYNVTQPNAATYARSMYNNNFIESDLINSYSWDTAIVFIQKYSGNRKYASKTPASSSYANTGKAGDEVLHIHDMASNCREWSTEHSTSSSTPCVTRGGMFDNIIPVTANRSSATTIGYNALSLRVVLYVK